MSENPYQAPSAALSDGLPTTTPRNYSQLAVAVFFPTIVAAAAFWIVPQFQRMFESFGASLPLATRVLLATYQWWGMIPVGIVAAWFAGRSTRGRQAAITVFGVASAALLFVFCVWACYKPILDLASER